MLKFIHFLISILFIASLDASEIILKRNKEPYTPLKYFVNIGFDTAQNRYSFSQKNLDKNYSRVFKYMGSPVDSINDAGGFDKLFTQEFLGSHAASNYALHFVGGGYDFRHLYEWYKVKKYPSPYALAFATAYLGNITNEAVEVNYKKLDAIDHLADLYFFDVAAKIVFLNDDLIRFMQDDIGMRKFDFTPMIDLQSLHFFNVGLNYLYRPPALEFGNYSPFIILGMQQMMGVSYKYNGLNYSGATGIFLLEPIERIYQYVFGFFVDRDGELLLSTIINGSDNYKLRVSLYPQLFYDKWKNRINLIAGITNEDDISIGMAIDFPIGLGHTTGLLRH